jgi:threonine dehydrogenase-like Zn-dependent dehydrogenase
MTPELALQTLTAEDIFDVSVGESPEVTIEAKAIAHAVAAVVGLGYVGLPTAIALRAAGVQIVGIDTSVR